MSGHIGTRWRAGVLLSVASVLALLVSSEDASAQSCVVLHGQTTVRTDGRGGKDSANRLVYHRITGPLAVSFHFSALAAAPGSRLLVLDLFATPRIFPRLIRVGPLGFQTTIGTLVEVIDEGLPFDVAVDADDVPLVLFRSGILRVEDDSTYPREVVAELSGEPESLLVAP